MRAALKKQTENFIQVIEKAHKVLGEAIDACNLQTALQLLEECQAGAISLGTAMEESEGEGFVAVGILEEYCELIYQIYETLSQNHFVDSGKVCKSLNDTITKVWDSIKDIPVRKEVVFLPYKASMWDSLESVWKAADADPECDAYVIPIPYYDKNPDGSFKEMHYEGDLYPDYVSVTDYNSYDFQSRRPDMIFIHNPYDGSNYVTSVHPFFYSSNLKNFTDKLVYIPYFVLGDVDPGNEAAVKGIEHFVTVPGVIHAHKVIVQSKNMRQAYINVLSREVGENTRSYWEEKISGLGSPKFDKVHNTKKENVKVPEEWLKIIQKPDGSRKKIIFYNTSVSALLQHGEQMLVKMKDVFRTFKENKEEVALLWRPHPLIKATIESMRPRLWEEYRQIVELYKEEGWGIYDDTADMDRAIALCDGYYGDSSSLVQLCREAGKAVMLQNVYSIKDNIQSLAMSNIVESSQNYYFLALKNNGIYSLEKNTYKTQFLARIPWEDEKNGTSPQYSKIYLYKNKLFIIPRIVNKVAVWNLKTREMSFLAFSEKMRIGLLYADAIPLGQYLYVIPCASQFVLRIDMERMKLEQIKITSEENSSLAWGSIYVENECIIFTELTGNSLYILNTNDNTIKKHETNLPVNGIAGICGDDNGVWIIPKKTDRILYWDRIKKQSIEYTDFPEGYISGELSFERVMLGKYLFLFPQDANMILRINRENGEMKNVFPQNLILDRENYYDKYIPFSYAWERGDKVYAVYSKTGCIYELQSGNRLDQTIFQSLDNGIQNVIWKTQSVLNERENSFENLNSYLRTNFQRCGQERNDSITIGGYIWNKICKC